MLILENLIIIWTSKVHCYITHQRNSQDVVAEYSGWQSWFFTTAFDLLIFEHAARISVETGATSHIQILLQLLTNIFRLYRASIVWVRVISLMLLVLLIKWILVGKVMSLAFIFIPAMVTVAMRWRWTLWQFIFQIILVFAQTEIVSFVRGDMVTFLEWHRLIMVGSISRIELDWIVDALRSECI